MCHPLINNKKFICGKLVKNKTFQNLLLLENYWG